MAQKQVFLNQKIIVIFLFLSTGITLFVNSYFRHSLYAMGIQLILSMQKFSNPYLDKFFVLITMTIDPMVVFSGSILLVILSSNKGKGIIMLCFILINTFFSALIKAYHCDPRPIWTRGQILNIGFYCPVEYGNPSGHSWFSAVLGFGTFLQYFGSGKNNKNVVICVIMTILVPVSRMYLGAHSINQVLQGLIFGMFFCLIFIIFLQDFIHKFLAQFNHNRNMKLVVIALHVLIIIPYILHTGQELPQVWLHNIHSKCSKYMNQVKLNQIMLTVNAVIINLLTGIALGYEQIVKKRIGALYLTGKWKVNQNKYGRIGGKLLFLFVQLICLTSGLGIAFLIFWIYRTFAVAYISLSIGAIVSGYLYTSKTIRMLSKYKIIVQKENEQNKNEKIN